jgi:hypothetical protein
MSDTKEITKQAIRCAGGPSKVAEAIVAAGGQCTSQAVSQWLRVPDIHVRLVERLGRFEVTRYRMRPDIFGDSPEDIQQGA